MKYKSPSTVSKYRPPDARYITFWVEQELFTQFKIQVLRQDKPMQRILHQMLTEWVAKTARQMKGKEK